MPCRPGIYNDVYIQNKVIVYVITSLGADMWDAVSQKTTVSLEPHLLLARDNVLPNVHVFTIRRWFMHYGKYGEVPALSRRKRFYKRRKKGGART